MSNIFILEVVNRSLQTAESLRRKPQSQNLFIFVREKGGPPTCCRCAAIWTHNISLIALSGRRFSIVTIKIPHIIPFWNP